MAKPTLLLYPGAGSDREHSSLRRIETELGAAADVQRFDFPYRGRAVELRTGHRS